MPSNKETDAHISGRLFFYQQYSADDQNKTQQNDEAFQRQEQCHDCYGTGQQHDYTDFSAEGILFMWSARLAAHMSMSVHYDHLMLLYENFIMIVQKS